MARRGLFKPEELVIKLILLAALGWIGSAWMRGMASKSDARIQAAKAQKTTATARQ